MTLRFLNDPNTVWNGRSLPNGQTPPPNAEAVMTNAELNSLGLGRQVQVKPKVTRAQAYAEPPVYAATRAGADQVVTETWAVRDKTQEEIDEELDQAIPGIDDVQFDIALDHENRIRGLEGQTVITPYAYRELLKSKHKNKV